MRVTTVLDPAWRTEGRVPPPLLLVGGLVAQSLVSRSRGGPLSRTAGALLGLGSAALVASAAAEYVRRRTTLDPFVPDASVLVTTGANAASRNPMYTGLVGLLVARAVARRSVRALVPAAAVAFLLETRQIPAEEQVLAERFGPDYEAYRESVPRWVDARSVEALSELFGSEWNLESLRAAQSSAASGLTMMRQGLVGPHRSVTSSGRKPTDS